MKILILGSLIVLGGLVFLGVRASTQYIDKEPTCCSADATCYGKTPCNACSTCEYCKYCSKDGGTCGVCK